MNPVTPSLKRPTCLSSQELYVTHNRFFISGEVPLNIAKRPFEYVQYVRSLDTKRVCYNNKILEVISYRDLKLSMQWDKRDRSLDSYGRKDANL